MDEGGGRRWWAAAAGAAIGVLLRVGGHARAVGSTGKVLEPIGIVGLLVLVAVGGWALIAAVRADDDAGRPLGRPVAVLGLLGWAVLGLVAVVVALAWL